MPDFNPLPVIGAIAFMAKPFANADIVSTVKGLLTKAAS